MTINKLALALATILISVFQQETAQARSHPHAPPVLCEFKQSSWCILYSVATYEDAPSQEEGYASRWTVRGGTWKDHPLIINEPIGCRSGISDTVELLGSEETVEWHGQPLTKVAIKLKSDGSCNLELLYPRADADPQEGAFFAAMTLIKACQNTACTSAPIGIVIRPRIHR